jgi:hypothetical protein
VEVGDAKPEHQLFWCHSRPLWANDPGIHHGGTPSALRPTRSRCPEGPAIRGEDGGPSGNDLGVSVTPQPGDGLGKSQSSAPFARFGRRSPAVHSAFAGRSRKACSVPRQWPRSWGHSRTSTECGGTERPTARSTGTTPPPAGSSTACPWRHHRQPARPASPPQRDEALLRHQPPFGPSWRPRFPWPSSHCSPLRTSRSANHQSANRRV